MYLFPMCPQLAPPAAHRLPRTWYQALGDSSSPTHPSRYVWRALHSLLRAFIGRIATGAFNVSAPEHVAPGCRPGSCAPPYCPGQKRHGPRAPAAGSRRRQPPTLDRLHAARGGSMFGRPDAHANQVVEGVFQDSSVLGAVSVSQHFSFSSCDCGGRYWRPRSEQMGKGGTTTR